MITFEVKGQYFRNAWLDWILDVAFDMYEEACALRRGSLAKKLEVLVDALDAANEPIYRFVGPFKFTYFDQQIVDGVSIPKNIKPPQGDRAVAFDEWLREQVDRSGTVGHYARLVQRLGTPGDPIGTVVDVLRGVTGDEWERRQRGYASAVRGFAASNGMKIVSKSARHPSQAGLMSPK